MSQEAVERLLGRLLTDSDFLSEMDKAFNETCFKYRFNLTDEEKEILRAMDLAPFRALSTKLAPGIQRSPSVLKHAGNRKIG